MVIDPGLRLQVDPPGDGKDRPVVGRQVAREDRLVVGDAVAGVLGSSVSPFVFIFIFGDAKRSIF